MGKIITKAITSLGLISILATSASATLYDRGDGLVYDSDQNITWLMNANYAETTNYNDTGAMTWDQAQELVSNLVYRGLDDWRLPNMTDINEPGCRIIAGLIYDGEDCGSNTDTSLSEIAYLYHDILGNISMRDKDGVYGQCPTSSPFCLQNISADGVEFQNVQDMLYWIGVDVADGTNSDAWVFSMRYGQQFTTAKTTNVYVWAVRDGDVPPLDSEPEPFTFTDVEDAELSSEYSSNEIKVKGIEIPSEISITGGLYSINGAEFTLQVGSVSDGDTVKVKRDSSSSYSSKVSATLSIGGISDSFDITTKDDGGIGTEVCIDPETNIDMSIGVVDIVDTSMEDMKFSFVINDVWSTGYCGRLDVTNTGSVKHYYPYGVHFKLPQDAEFSSTWSGDVTKEGEDVTVIFKSWTKKVAAGKRAGEPFGFCVNGTSRPHSPVHYEPDFSDVDVEFVVSSKWNGGYCGKFTYTYNGKDEYSVHPDKISFLLPSATMITETWNGKYKKEGNRIDVDLPSWVPHLYPGDIDNAYGFCACGNDLPCWIKSR